jgi:hypothetical protein
MRSVLFGLALVAGFQLATLASWAQYPGQFYSPGMNNPMVGYNAAGYGDYVFGPRVIVIEDGYRAYRPYYSVRPIYRRW